MLKFKYVNIASIFIAFVLILASVFFDFYLYISLLFLLFIWFIITVIGSFHIRWNYHLTSFFRGNGKSNYVSLTFDDGPHPEYTVQVLGLLKKYDMKATFFCIGKSMEKHPDLVVKIIKEGHEIGNHTYSHSNQLGFFSTKRFLKEIELSQQVFKRIINKYPNFFRPPFGVTNPNIAKALAQSKLISIGWSIRSLDTTGKGSAQILKRITRNLKKNEIILMHDTGKKTVTVLEQLLLYLKKNNLKSVPVSVLLKKNPYA